MDFKIEWVGTTNFMPGRNGQKPIAIVDHITAGSYPGCLSWMQNSKAKASAHYLITRAGRILQLVKDEDTAWANGAVSNPSWPLYDGSNPNKYTLSIEHEGQPSEPLTEIQIEASIWLHKQLIAKWGIPISTSHIIGHYRIDSVNRPNCPGPNFPWERLLTDLKKGANLYSTETPAKVIIGGKEFDAYLKGGVMYWGSCVPVRETIEALQVSLDWNQELLTAMVKLGGGE